MGAIWVTLIVQTSKFVPGLYSAVAQLDRDYFKNQWVGIPNNIKDDVNYDQK